ncbi:hypothetical protein ASE74_19590 [Pedobacter sp. Leaf216]|nr:hypothetical protein ASE74_19590 [Pedobacter sp. Leaf216]
MAIGCQKGELDTNPNVAGVDGIIPRSLLLNNLTSTLIRTDEQPWALSSVGAQYSVSNYQYYRFNNNYNYGNTSDSYDILKYAITLEQQSVKQAGGSSNNVYFALSQFFKAYSGIWLTQRVGDIPFSQAGNLNNLTPGYDSQHDVYKSALAMLDNASTVMKNLIAATPTLAAQKVDAGGDIFNLTYLQWQKLINTYTLRTLISLSKRAQDNGDLQVLQKFAAIVNNPTQYPIMTGNGDNMVYVYNAVNRYPIYTLLYNSYNNFSNIGSTYLSIGSQTKDPRILVTSTPAPAQVTGGKAVSDFSAYVGSDINLAQSVLLNNSNNGMYSFANYNRYYVSQTGANAEPFIFIGYPEMCFNIAEAVNRGWVTGQTASSWYLKGINASLANYGLTEGQVITINFPIGSTDVKINPTGLKQGSAWGTATVNISEFLAKINYAGDNNIGLNQILTQKYMAMFNNSGWEAFYNYRRTGIPALLSGGAGIGTANGVLPRRWMYMATESAYNTQNFKKAIDTQLGGSDDPLKDTWLTK